jgi:hypothetical protein
MTTLKELFLPELTGGIGGYAYDNTANGCSSHPCGKALEAEPRSFL